MMWCIAAVAFAFFGTIQAQLTQTVCVATYGGSPTSVPKPGREFLIQVIPIGSSIVQGDLNTTDSGYLDSTGQIQGSCEKSDVFRLFSGQLFSGPNQISVARNISSARFGTSEHVEALYRIFAIAPGETLIWNNDTFAGGSARFSADNGGVVRAIFAGPIAGNSTAVTLKAVDASDCPSSQSGSPGSKLSSAAVQPLASQHANSFVLPLASAGRMSTSPFTPKIATPTVSKAAASVNSRGGQAFPTGTLSGSGSSTTIHIAPPSQSITGSLSNLSSPAVSTSPFSSADSRTQPNLNTLLSSNTSSVTSSGFSISSSPSSPSITSSPTITSSATSTDLVGVASSVLYRNSFTEFCSTYLGLTAAAATATVDSNMTASTALITQPTNIIDTELVTVSSYVTEVVPSQTVTLVTTPIVDTTSIVAVTDTTTATEELAVRDLQYRPLRPYVAKRQASALAVPTALQSYDPIVLSSACSEIISSATAATVTTTLIATIFETSFDTQPYATQDSTILTADTTTIDDSTSTAAGSTIPLTSNVLTTSTDLDTTTIIPVTTTQASNTTQSSNTTVTPTPIVSSTPITSSTTSQTTNICPPTIVLASPTPIVGSLSGSRVSVDDNSYNLNLPFQMRIFDHASSSIYVSTNGIISLDQGSDEFHNSCPPTAGPDSSHQSYVVPPYSAFPFWDDTYVYKNSPQGIYYEYGYSGTTPTAVSFEFYLSHYFNNTQYYHYTMLYDSASPGQFTYRYYQISDVGFSSTVGIQNNNLSSPGAPTALTFFCSTCADNPDTTQSGHAKKRDIDTLLEKRQQQQNCPAGTIVPGLQLFVSTYPNNTGTITQNKFNNCA